MPVIQSKRLHRRLLRHHLPLFTLSTVCVAALYLTRPYTDVLSRASFATAYPALILLVLALLVGPLNLLKKRPNPVSSDLRRDLGIWAAILSILHVAIGQNVHLRGKPWLYYVYAPREHYTFPIRHDLFGAANYTGAISILIVIALLATSNDLSLRAFGTVRWKQLQRWNYAASALAAIHSVAYLAIEKQKLQWVTTVVLCIAVTLSLQIAGFAKRRPRAFKKL